MNISSVSVADIANQMVPLTYFRRNAGDVLAKLANAGQLIIIKDGKPVATLTAVSSVVQGHMIPWDMFLEKVNVCRTFTGKRGNLSAIIARDRQDH